MRVAALLSVSAVAAWAVPALAQQADAVGALTEELKAHAPPQWDVRVRWRDGDLLASITPLPYQEAFQLWYDPQKLADALIGFCPGPKSEIWTLIKADQDIVLEPTVGGKSSMEARVSCRRAKADPS